MPQYSIPFSILHLTQFFICTLAAGSPFIVTPQGVRSPLRRWILLWSLSFFQVLNKRKFFGATLTENFAVSKLVVEFSIHKVTIICYYHLLQPSSYLNCLWQLPQGYLRKGSSSPCCLARWSRNKHFHYNTIFKNETLMPIKSL